MTPAKKKTDSAATGVGCLFLLLLGIGGALNGFDYLDSIGWISHETEAGITAQQTWFVGESKSCTSSTYVAPLGDKPLGYALDAIECDSGPVHQVNIKFWGRKAQPEYAGVYWKCTRHENGFECFEMGGVPKLK
jgi:hypothetical protein